MGFPSSTAAVFKSLSLLLCILVIQGSSSTSPIGGQVDGVLAADPANVVTNLVLTPEDTFISASWTLENNGGSTQGFEVSYAGEGGGTTSCSIEGGYSTNTENCRTTAGQTPVLSSCTAYTVTVTPQAGAGVINGVPASDSACTTGCAGGDTCPASTAATTTTTAQPTTTTTQLAVTTTTPPTTTSTTQPTTTTTTEPTTTTATQPTTTSKTQPMTTTTTQPMTTTTTQPTAATTTQPTTIKTTEQTTTTTTDTTTLTTTTTTTPTGSRTVDVVLLSLIGVVSVLIIALVATFYVNWDAVLKKLGLRATRKLPT